MHRLAKSRVAHTLVWFLVCVGLLVSTAVSAEEPLPIAQTVPVAGDNRTTGAVVRFDDVTETYQVASTRGDQAVYGVIAERPAIVFVTGTSSVPVVTNGVATVQSSNVNGPITRGDLLMASDQPGVAIRASTTDTGVFARALGAPDVVNGLVTADVSVARATAYQATLQAQAAADTADPQAEPPVVRLVIATLLVTLAVAFLLYSYRTILNSGVVSIGRNPRARQSVMYATIGSTALAIIIAMMVVLVALGVVVVPL